MVVEDPPISELRAQGQRAVDVLVDRHYARICHYLLRLVGDAALAEDLAQETFLRAYLALPRLADGSNVSAWLFAIATNLAREHHRRQQVRGWPRRADHARAAGVERLCDGERQRGHAGGAAGFEDEVAQQDLVRRALEQLPLDQRVCLLLYAWTGYTCVEIGEILGRSTAAVRMLLVRARRRFRAAYGNGLDCAAPASGAADGTGDAAGGGTTAPRSGTGRGGKGSVGKAGKKMDGARDHLLEAPGHLQGHRDRCEGVQEVLPFYPRGDLPRDAFAAVTRHLAGCARCRQALAAVQATYRLLQAHLNTAPIGSVPRVKAAIMAGLALPAGGPDQPPASAPVPAPVVVRRAVHQEHLPWPRWPGWPGGDPPAPRSRR